MNIEIRFAPRKVLAPDGVVRQGTAIHYTVTEDDGSITYAITNTWEVLAPSPFNIGYQREQYLRRHQPGFYRATEVSHGQGAQAG